MSVRNTSTYLLPTLPTVVVSEGMPIVGGDTESIHHSPQSAQKLEESGGLREGGRLPSVGARLSRISNTSASNVYRSLSTIYRSISALPASLLDLDAISATGLQVIRPDTHPEAFVPVPPDGGWGWVVVFAAFISNLIIDGIYVSFGIMVTDLVEHFNTSVATVMLMGSLLLGVYQIVGPVAAGLVNRFGCRAVGMGGSLLAAVSMFVSAFMPTINLMLVSYGFITGAAFGLIHLPSVICVSFYFDSRRSLAIGIMSVGTPLGAMIFAPLTDRLLKELGWSNTLILFAGMLLNCTAFAALYRPLMPTMALMPMKASEAKMIKSLLQLAAGEEAAVAASGDRLAASGTTLPIASQYDLRGQTVLEEDEEAGEELEETTRPSQLEANDGQDKPTQVHLETIVEGTEGETGAEEKREQEIKNTKTTDKMKPRHHRHHGRRIPRKTLYKKLQQQYALWLQGVRSLRGFRARREEEVVGEDTAGDADLDRTRGEVDASDLSSNVSTCGSSCDEQTSHWDSDSGSASASDAEMVSVEDEAGSKAATGGDNGEIADGHAPMRLLKKRSCGPIVSGSSRALISQGKKSTFAPRTGVSADFVFSVPNLGQTDRHSIGLAGGLGQRERQRRQHQRQQQLRRHQQGVRRRCHQSECHPSRMYTRPIQRQSVVQLANILVPRRRCESVTVGGTQRSRLSSVGSPMFAFTAGGGGGTGGGEGTPVEELVENAPVIVELPHESITVEDYARPLYRKDIFFPGSVKRQMESSIASITAAAANIMETPDDQIGGSQVSLGIAEGPRRRKTTLGTSQFGSSIFFGENVPLPPITEMAVLKEGLTEDANWTGHCLMSLTKIPLPDVFNVDEERRASVVTTGVTGIETDVKDEAKLLDRLKMETGLKLSETRADGIFRVPRSHSLCGWWLCWETRRMSSAELVTEEMDEMERFKRSLMDDGEHRHELLKFPHYTRLVLIRKCLFLPKSMFDVLMTMMNLSLLKEKSFSIYCLASLFAVMGIYVPLFFVCDLAESFGIPKSQSAQLLTAYGGVSVASRLAASWAAGRLKISSTMLCAFTLLLSGVAVCAMPFWGSFIGQVTLMAIFGLAVSPFFVLTSIILCDILDLEALTNAYGIVTMVRGIASAVGSPVAGIIVTSTGTFSVALLIAGVLVMIGGFLYVCIIFLERAKLNEELKNSLDTEQGGPGETREA